MAINGNGHDKDKESVVSFPTLAERDRIRKAKEAAELELREKYKKERQGKKQPFFNSGKIPPLTRLIVIAFFVVQIPVYFLLDDAQRLQLFHTFGFVSAIYSGDVPWRMPALVAPITHIFLHGGWMHIAFNTVMMLAMGVFTERTFGTRRMAIFFIFSGLCGVGLYYLFNMHATVPLIGASGSISGLFAITFYNLYEQGQLGPAGKRGPLPLIALWIALMVGTGLVSEDVAWIAHLGGFLGGLGLYHALRKKWISF